MIFTKTSINGLYVIELEPKIDERGYFLRVFCQTEFKNAGLDYNIINTNRSFSRHKGTIRGLHFQKEPMAEVKIVQCLRGRIFDVVVDLRTESPTYKQWFGIELTENNNKMLYVPKGFAHGIQTLSDNCILEYFINQFYSPQHEGGFLWNDPAFKIIWPLPVSVMSERDRKWRLFN